MALKTAKQHIKSIQARENEQSLPNAGKLQFVPTGVGCKERGRRATGKLENLYQAQGNLYVALSKEKDEPCVRRGKHEVDQLGFRLDSDWFRRQLSTLFEYKLHVVQ